MVERIFVWLGYLGFLLTLFFGLRKVWYTFRRKLVGVCRAIPTAPVQDILEPIIEGCNTYSDLDRLIAFGQQLINRIPPFDKSKLNFSLGVEIHKDFRQFHDLWRDFDYIGEILEFEIENKDHISSLHAVEIEVPDTGHCKISSPQINDFKRFDKIIEIGDLKPGAKARVTCWTRMRAVREDVKLRSNESQGKLFFVYEARGSLAKAAKYNEILRGDI